MRKRLKIRHPGAILLIWVCVASLIAIYIYVKFGGTGKTIGVYIIALLFVLLLYPVVRYLQHDLAQEQEELVLIKINRLINQGKYDKAMKYLSRNQLHIRDEDRLTEIKKQISQEI